MESWKSRCNLIRGNLKITKHRVDSGSADIQKKKQGYNIYGWEGGRECHGGSTNGLLVSPVNSVSHQQIRVSLI
jgi:hypothetical protein